MSYSRRSAKTIFSELFSSEYTLPAGALAGLSVGALSFFRRQDWRLPRLVTPATPHAEISEPTITSRLKSGVDKQGVFEKDKLQQNSKKQSLPSNRINTQGLSLFARNSLRKTELQMEPSTPDQSMVARHT